MSNKAVISEFLATEFPQSTVRVEAVGARQSRVRQVIGEQHLRPGGTVSGPTMMALADNALYVAILGEIGLVALAVTTSLNVNFLRKPAAGRDIIADCRLIKVGKTLITGDVMIYSDGGDEPVAHAVGTYSVPPRE